MSKPDTVYSSMYENIINTQNILKDPEGDAECNDKNKTIFTDVSYNSWNDIKDKLQNNCIVKPYDKTSYKYVFTRGDGHCGYYAYLFAFLKKYANKELSVKKSSASGDNTQVNNRAKLIKVITTNPPNIANVEEDNSERMQFPPIVVNKFKGFLIDQLTTKTKSIKDINDLIKKKTTVINADARWEINSQNIDLTSFNIKNDESSKWEDATLSSINILIDQIRTGNNKEEKEKLNLYMLIIINDGSNDGGLKNIMALMYECFGIRYILGDAKISLSKNSWSTISIRILKTSLLKVRYR